MKKSKQQHREKILSRLAVFSKKLSPAEKSKATARLCLAEIQKNLDTVEAKND